MNAFVFYVVKIQEAGSRLYVIPVAKYWGNFLNMNRPLVVIDSDTARVFIAGAKHIGVSRKFFLGNALYFGYRCDQLYRLTSR